MDSEGFLGAITSKIGHASSLEAEFSACMVVIEKAKEIQLTQVCFEIDSMMVFKAFTNKSASVP